MAKRSKGANEFATGIDDSGGHAELFEPDGTRIESPNQPLVGVAAVTVRVDLLPRFEYAWNALRTRIQRELDLPEPPPIHIRWMWGTNRADPRKNPYVNASAEQIAGWLSEAVGIVVRFTAYRHQFGIIAQFYGRSQLQDFLDNYYSDPASELEREFLASRLVPKNLYNIYHRATVYPLIRVLQFALWKLDESLKVVGGSTTSVTIDAFTGTGGVEAPEAVRAIQEFHRRALLAFELKDSSISVLTDEGQRRAEAYAAAKMTGPRSKTAAE